MREEMSNKKKYSLWHEIVRNRNNYYMMAGYLICFFIFVILPVIAAIILSFTNFNLLQTPRFAGLENYLNLFLHDPIFKISIMNALVLAAITGPAGYILSLLLAWAINEVTPKIRAFLTLLFYAPSISGGAAYLFTIIFSNDSYGYMNSLLYSLGLIDTPIQWLSDSKYMLWVCVIAQLWMSMGLSFLSFIAGLQGIDKTLYEAASVDGIRNRYQQLWFITLPCLKPQLLFGAVTSITGAFTIGDIVTQLFGNPSNNYAMHTLIQHMQDYGNTRFEMGYACAVATVLFVLMVVTNLVVQRLLRKVGS